MAEFNQDSLPTEKALRAYEEDAVVLHIPGHGGRPPHPLLEEYGFQSDLPTNEYLAENPDLAGQALAAQAWGADRAWWILGGASQGNQATLLGLTDSEDLVLASRGSHVSVVSGLIFSGAQVQWVQPKEHPSWETLEPLGEEELARALGELEQRGEQAKCVVVTSPTYFGEVADIPALSRLCHEHGCFLFVDGSWGSHFGFHSGLPSNPLHEGADLMLASTHKHAGSLRGTALILARDTQWLPHSEHDKIERSLRWLASTSPSFPMRLSLDAARWQQINHGDELWGGVLEVAEAARERLAQVPLLMVADQYLPAHQQDRSRLILDVSSSGWNGIELEAKLAREHKIFVEMGTGKLLVCMISHSTSMDDIERLAQALERELPHPQMGPGLGMIPRFGENVMTPRQAALGPVRPVPLREAEGLVSAEIVSVYPPGIPVLAPGVRIGRLDIDYLGRALKAGGRLYGGVDSSGQSVLVADL